MVLLHVEVAGVVCEAALQLYMQCIAHVIVIAKKCCPSWCMSAHTASHASSSGAVAITEGGPSTHHCASVFENQGTCLSTGSPWNFAGVPLSLLC